MPREAFVPSGTAVPESPYSPVVRLGGLVQTSGQVGEDPLTEEPLEGIEAQTRQALHNLERALAAAGAGLDDVIRVGVYLSSLEDFAAMNAAYREFFSPPFPARTTVQVGLPEGLLVEIDALAVVTTPITSTG